MTFKFFFLKVRMILNRPLSILVRADSRQLRAYTAQSGSRPRSVSGITISIPGEMPATTVLWWPIPIRPIQTRTGEEMRVMCSRIKMILILLLILILILLVVLFGGPTAYLFQSFIYAIGDYLIQLIPMSFKTYAYTPAGSWNWFHGWTLTYLIWWLAWGPFVGIFIARISRGRTIREFMVGVMFVPTTIAFFWLCIFGGNALYMELNADGGVGTAGMLMGVAGAFLSMASVARTVS